MVVFEPSREAARRFEALASEQGLDGHSLTVDVARARDVQRGVAAVTIRYGAIHVLVNAAEAEHAGALHETAEEDWDRVLGVNLKGLFLLSRQVLPVMMRAGGGVVVNLGCSGPPPQGANAAFAASKGGVIQLTRLMAADYARNNIRVNCLCPGLARSGPSGRPGAQQIAQAILFLASEEASFISGVVLPVDGGSSAR